MGNKVPQDCPKLSRSSDHRIHCKKSASLVGKARFEGSFGRKWGQKSEIEQVGSRRKWDIVGLDLVLVTIQFWEAFYGVLGIFKGNFAV